MPQLIHQDIIDQIIYALRSDRATLLRCSAVSHSFLTPSRKQLFFNIEISDSHTTSLDSLIHVLSIHPEYLSYIRILERLEIDTIEKPSFVRLIEDVADRRALRVFSLEIQHAWEALSVPIQTALVRLFQSLSLHTIVSHMCGHTFPVHVLGYWPATSRFHRRSQLVLPPSNRRLFHYFFFALGQITRHLLGITRDNLGNQ